jgi:hypothetical protein
MKRVLCIKAKSDKVEILELWNSRFQRSRGRMIGTQGRGKPKITSHSKIFVRISGIGISTFLLTRSRVLHIRISEILKCKIPLEESFSILAFQDLGSRGDNDLESRVLNSWFAKSRGKKTISAFW